MNEGHKLVARDSGSGPLPSASDPDFMLSLARGLMVLEAVADSPPRMTASALSKKTGLSRAVVGRCLHTLVKLNYLKQVEREFHIRPRLMTLADTIRAGRSVPMIVQPVLEDLRAELGEACSFGILDNDDVLYVARVIQPRLVAVTLQVGSRLPAWGTSMGRVLLAHLPEDELESFFSRAKLVPRTSKTITDPTRLRQIIRQVYIDGYAIVDQEIDLQLRSIAVPVRDERGFACAALNLSASAAHMTVEDLRERALPRLLSAAIELNSVKLDD